METELNEADKALDYWEIAQRKADHLATVHKHQTAAQVNVHAVGSSVAKAKETVIATNEWLDRQLEADDWSVSAQAGKYKYDMAIRRWETARSEFSARGRVV